MIEELLPQTCQILQQVEVINEWNPDTEANVVVFDNVPCRLDTTITMRGLVPMSNPNELNVPNRTGGLMWIVGNYGSGSSRLFNEQNFVKLEGFTYEVLAVHDVWDADSVHHYELEVYRGVNR